MSDFHETIVEEAALACLEGLGYSVKRGPEIAPEEFLSRMDGNLCKKYNSSVWQIGTRELFPKRKLFDV